MLYLYGADINAVDEVITNAMPACRCCRCVENVLQTGVEVALVAAIVSHHGQADNEYTVVVLAISGSGLQHVAEQLLHDDGRVQRLRIV